MKFYGIVGIKSLLFYSALQACFAGIHDDTSTNKFLSVPISSCSQTSRNCNTADLTTSSMYVDQRQTLDGFFGCCFAQHKDRVFYFFNEFGYWSAKREQYATNLNSAGVYANQASQVAQQTQSEYPGAGIYMIAISAMPAFVARVGQNVPCDSGNITVAAILFFNDGNGFQPLSASCIAVMPSDPITLYISSNTSGAVDVPAGVSAFSGVLTTSPSGSVNFQAKTVTVTPPPTLESSSSNSNNKNKNKGNGSKTSSSNTSVSESGSASNAGTSSASISASSNQIAAIQIVPGIQLGQPALNLGGSPQSISLRKT